MPDDDPQMINPTPVPPVEPTGVIQIAVAAGPENVRTLVALTSTGEIWVYRLGDAPGKGRFWMQVLPALTPTPQNPHPQPKL